MCVHCHTKTPSSIWLSSEKHWYHNVVTSKHTHLILITEHQFTHMQRQHRIWWACTVYIYWRSDIWQNYKTPVEIK